MTALAANKARKTAGGMRLYPAVMLAADSITIYEGAVLMDNGSGLATVGADTAGATVLGIAADYKVTGTTADHYPRIEVWDAEWFVNDGNITAAMIGNWATLLDDKTASNAGTTTNDVPFGRILKLETIDSVSGVWLAVGVFGGIVAP